MPDEYKYYAFISYSSADKPWADWLKRKLERYRIPRRIEGLAPEGAPRTFRPVFRDRGELRSSWSLQTVLREALQQSQYLIVICSPTSAASAWVNEEIRFFRSLGRTDRIIPLIVEGRPGASSPSEGACFPPELRQMHSVDGEQIGLLLPEKKKDTPAAADARPERDGREGALLRIIAGLLSVNIEAVIQKERQRRRWRRVFAAAIVLLLVAAALAVWDYNRLKVRHYRTYVDKWGIPSGVGELRGSEWTQKYSYRFESRRGKLRRVVYVNSRDEMSSLTLRTDVPATQVMFQYRENEHLYRRDYLDRFDKSLVSEELSEDGGILTLHGKNDVTSFADADPGWEAKFTGASEQDITPWHNLTTIARYEITRDGEGRILRSISQNYLGAPAVGSDGVWGIEYHYNAAGDIDEWINLGPGGKPGIDSHGLQRVRTTYNADHGAVEVACLGADGRLTLCKEGYARQVNRYNAAGLEDESRYYGSDGRPITLPNGFCTIEFDFDPQAHLVQTRYRDTQGRLTTHHEGYALASCTNDANGWTMSKQFLDTHGQPCLSRDGISKFVEERDADENVVREVYYGTKGERVPSGGYYECRFAYDVRGNRTRTEYRDLDGKLMFAKDGYAVEEDDYDSRDRQVEVRFRGPDGQLCVPAGEHRKVPVIRVSYKDDGSQMSSANFDFAGLPMLDQEGIHEYRHKFNEYGTLAESACFGTDGRPAITKDGYHRYVMKFDPLGRVVEGAYFGADDAPVLVRALCCHGETVAYTELGQIASVSTFDARGKRCNAKQGYAEIHYRYDADGQEVEEAYFDADGLPTLTPDGIGGERYRHDGRGNVIEATAIGAGNAVGITKDGYSTERETYDESNRVVESAAYNTDGSPATMLTGGHRVKKTYDPQGNVTRWEVFGTDGKPAYSRYPAAKFFGEGQPASNQWLNVELFFSSLEIDYDVFGQAVAFYTFGLEGEPVLGLGGAHGCRIADDAQGNRVEFTFVDADHHPTMSVFGFAGMRFGYDALGRETNEYFVGADGAPILHVDTDSNAVYAGCRRTLDAQGRTVKLQLLDETLRPFISNLGFAAQCSTYDAFGNEIERRYVDLKGTNVKGSDGYAVLKFEYDPLGHITRQQVFDEHGTPVPQDKGVYSYQMQFNAAGQIVSQINLDAAGQSVQDETGTERIEVDYDSRGMETERRSVNARHDLVPTAEGFAKVVSSYNDVGQMVAKRYYSVDGKLVDIASFGYTQEIWTYDNLHRLVEIEVLDAAGRPASGKTGIAVQNTSYFAGGNETKNFDAKGKPTAGEESWARRVYHQAAQGMPEHEEVFDAKGKPLIGVLRIGTLLPNTSSASLGLEVGDLIVQVGKWSARESAGNLLKDRSAQMTAVLVSAKTPTNGFIIRKGKVMPFSAPPGPLGVVLDNFYVAGQTLPRPDTLHAASNR